MDYGLYYGRVLGLLVNDGSVITKMKNEKISVARDKCVEFTKKKLRITVKVIKLINTTRILRLIIYVSTIDRYPIKKLQYITSNLFELSNQNLNIPKKK